MGSKGHYSVAKPDFVEYFVIKYVLGTSKQVKLGFFFKV